MLNFRGFLVLVASFFTFACSCAKHYATNGIQAAVAVDLNLIYQQERAFHARYGVYTTDLVALKAAPPSVLYKFGFVRAASLKALTKAETSPLPADLDNAMKDLDAVKAAHKDFVIEYSPSTKLATFTFDKLSAFCSDCTATATTFKAIAAANLDDDPILDVWTIDQNGKIQHLIDDLK